MRALVRIRRVDGCMFADGQRGDAVQFAGNRSSDCGEGVQLFLAGTWKTAPDQGCGELDPAGDRFDTVAGTGAVSAGSGGTTCRGESLLCERSLLPSTSVF